MQPCKIGTVARELGVSTRRIIEYERAGLIHPIREPRTGDRLFDEQDIAQLTLVRHLLQDVGFSIAALHELFRRAPCWELTNCNGKHSCPVPRSPFVACYELRAAGTETPRARDCARCSVRAARTGPRPAPRTPLPSLAGSAVSAFSAGRCPPPGASGHGGIRSPASLAVIASGRENDVTP